VTGEEQDDDCDNEMDGTPFAFVSPSMNNAECKTTGTCQAKKNAHVENGEQQQGDDVDH
jgi:hypothetical protein